MSAGYLALLDQVSKNSLNALTATKASLKDTTAILVDDGAVGSEKASKFSTEKETEGILRIAKGSFFNKLKIIAVVFFLYLKFSFLITVLLVLGGMYLAYEGAEKVEEYVKYSLLKLPHKGEEEKEVSFEQKVKDAILTDFILSLEIVVIALNSVLNFSIPIQFFSLLVVAVLTTGGIYGLIWCLVKLDDLGIYMINSVKKEYENSENPEAYKNTKMFERGMRLINILPKIVKILTFIGTIAMLAVAGGIFTHNIDFVHHFYEDYFHLLPEFIFNIFLGLIIGYIEVLIFHHIIDKFNLVERFLESRFLKSIKTIKSYTGL